MTEKAAGYMRIGCGTADMQHHALNAQEAAIRQQADREGYQLVEVYFDIDQGISQQRPGLLRMLSAAETGRFAVLVTPDPSRLFRVRALLDRYVHRLVDEYGIRLEYLNDEIQEEMAE
jgi:DNA invertase Pin-like site-specific DNA recombinase